MKNRPIRHRIEYGLYLTLKGLLRALPHEAARRLGRGVGALGHALDRRHRDLAASWGEAMADIVAHDPKSLILAVADMARSNPPASSSFVAELMNATLNTETVLGEEIGPVTIPSIGVEGAF